MGREKRDSEHNGQNAWLSIAVTLISVLGSIGVAYITSVYTSKKEQITSIKSAIHFESGFYSLDPQEAEKYKFSSTTKASTNWKPRIVRIPFTFDREFDFVPVVRASINALDVDAGKNLRIDVFPEAITCKGFTLKIQTWQDTRINYAAVNWFAYEKTYDQTK